MVGTGDPGQPSTGHGRGFVGLGVGDPGHSPTGHRGGMIMVGVGDPGQPSTGHERGLVGLGAGSSRQFPTGHGGGGQPSVVHGRKSVESPTKVVPVSVSRLSARGTRV